MCLIWSTISELLMKKKSILAIYSWAILCTNWLPLIEVLLQFYSCPENVAFFMPSLNGHSQSIRKYYCHFSSFIFINPIKYNKTINFDYTNYSLMREWIEGFFAIIMSITFFVNWIFYDWFKDEIKSHFNFNLYLKI